MPGAIPPSMIPILIPTSVISITITITIPTIFMNDSDSDSDSDCSTTITLTSHYTLIYSTTIILSTIGLWMKPLCGENKKPPGPDKPLSKTVTNSFKTSIR